jgi:hypothetical protein
MALVRAGCERTIDGESVFPPFPLLQLPNELIYHIASFAREEDHIWLATTCMRIYNLFLSCPSRRGGKARIYAGPRSYASSVPRFNYVMQERERIVVEHPDDTVAKIDIFYQAWHSAISNGNVPVLKHLRNMNRYHFDKWNFHLAAEHGQIGILQYMASIDKNWDTQTCSRAATHGQLTTLQWLRKNECPWNTSTCTSAANGGHLHVLQWARDHGCPWDKWTCIVAANNNHLHILQWARVHGCSWDKAHILRLYLMPKMREWVQAQPE